MKIQEIKELTKGQTYDYNGRVVQIAGVTRKGDAFLFGVKNGGFISVHENDINVFLDCKIEDQQLAVVKKEVQQTNIERGTMYVPNANVVRMGDGLMALFDQLQTAEGPDLEDIIEKSKACVSIANTVVAMEKLTVDAIKIAKS